MKLFCITKDTKYRIINILGIKLRFRSKYRALQHKVNQLEDELMTCKENIKCAFLSNYYSGIPTKNPKDPWHKHLIKVVTDSYDIIDSAERNANRVIVYMTEQTQETGLADRIRTMTTAYIMAAEAGRDFYIYHDKGFKLEDYLLPNEVDWRISQDDISKGINKVSFLFLYSRFQKLTDTGREWHIYQSNNIIDNQFLPDALKDKYSDASVFRKLFRIHPDLMTHAAQVMENMGITERGYVAVHTRFLNFFEQVEPVIDKSPKQERVAKDVDFGTGTEDEKAKMLLDMKYTLENIHRETGLPIVLFSDTNSFLASPHAPYVHLVPGTVGHICLHQKADTIQKTFLDLIIMSKAETVYSILGENLHRMTPQSDNQARMNGFSHLGAYMGNRPFIRYQLMDSNSAP